MYKFIVKIAGASLIRRRLRSLLVILMIGMSLWGLLFMEGLYEGMTEQMIGNAIRSDSGDLSIYLRGYREDSDVTRLIQRENELGGYLSSLPAVRSSVDRIIQDCLAATAHYSQNGVALGIDLMGEKHHGRLDRYITSGEYSFGKKGKGVLVGSKLAEKLKVGIGSKLILTAQDSTGEISALSLRVTGIIKTNNMMLDSRALLIDLERARKLLGVPQGVNQVSVIMDRRQSAASVQQQISDRFPELEPLRWDQLYPALMQSKEIMDIFNLVTSAIVFTIAGIGIFGVMMVSVLERLREFGVMLALGTGHRTIYGIILTESMLLGMFGFAAGSILGFLTLLYFKTYGLDLSGFSTAIETFGMDAVTYAVIRPTYFFTAGIAVILATLASIVMPLRVLKKSKPVNILHSL